MPNRRFVGLEVVAPFDELDKVIPAAWNELRTRRDEIGGKVNDVISDVTLGDSMGAYHTLIAVEVAPGTEPPPGMVAFDVPPHRALHRSKVAAADEIPAVYNEMLEWAAASGLVTDGLKIDDGYVAVAGRRRKRTPHDLHVRIAS